MQIIEVTRLGLKRCENCADGPVPVDLPDLPKPRVEPLPMAEPLRQPRRILANAFDFKAKQSGEIE